MMMMMMMAMVMMNAPEGEFWSTGYDIFGAHLEHPGLQGCTMIHQFSVGKSEVSMSLGHKSAMHVHSSGICMLKWTSPKAFCSPSMEYYCFVSKTSTRGWIWD